MKGRFLVVLALIGCLPYALFAQDAAKKEGDNKNIQEYVIDTFEVNSQWKAVVSSDLGFSTLRLLNGAPADKASQKKNLNDQTDFADEKVLGLKVDFVRRAFDEILIKPDSPIQIRGVVKSVSFWTIGRLYNHNISLLFTTYSGQKLVIPVGTMNHYGWKKMEVEIPESIVQTDPNYPCYGGMEFTGFLISLDAMEIRGDYYIYFDDLRITSDIALESYNRPDDIEDIW